MESSGFRNNGNKIKRYNISENIVDDLCSCKKIAKVFTDISLEFSIVAEH